jgi:hypothetical protein
MNPEDVGYPLQVVQVIEKEHGASRSSFHCETGSSAKRMRMSVSSSDSECCTKALRLVSGSDSAIHPRDWSNDATLKGVFTSILYWELFDKAVE